MTKAKEMFLLGEWFSAQDAKELGLVIDVMKPEDLMPRAMAVAEKLAKKDPFAVSRSKKLINSHVYKAMDQVMDDENDAIMEVVMAMMQKQKAQKKLKKKSKL
jgi:enoyl-CoA hydratase/carnithine racemase